MFFHFRIKAKLSLAIVKQLSRLAQGQRFLSQALNVVVCTHTNLHTRIHPHMRIHPPDLAALFSLQWEMGNIFPGDVLLLSIRKIVFAPPGGSSDGEMSPSVQPHLSPSECFSSLSLLRLPFFPYLFVSLYLALTFPLHLLHSLS